MEATGVYWKPVWHILSDGDFELVLANAAHVKNLPGRKTDVKDADWISGLLVHGLILPSFVPDGPTQDMRTLLRTRKQLSREKASHILRIQKALEDSRRRQHQVGLGGHRHHGPERAKDDRSDDCWPDRSCEISPFGRSPG
jgi:transposase